MPARLASLLDLQSVTNSQIHNLFSLADSLKKSPGTPRNQGETVALAFFEPSTRTRLSFESAAIRAGVGPLVFEGGQKTSLEKGETVEDSLLNIAAMMPKIVVTRCQDLVDLAKIAPRLGVPVVNAGWGVKGHPTQALLDAYTLRNAWKDLAGKKLLIVGDVKHSRVVASHLEIYQRLGFELGQCGPRGFLLANENVQTFEKLREGLEWADAVMALRFQFERHDASLQFSKEEYRSHFGLNAESVTSLKKQGLILHPGPINHGIEMETEVLSDPRCKVLEQVQNGVFVREAILRTILGESSGAET
jgi:aspartate carbamoyltransferase catalytic subunit